MSDDQNIKVVRVGDLPIKGQWDVLLNGVWLPLHQVHGINGFFDDHLLAIRPAKPKPKRYRLKGGSVEAEWDWRYKYWNIPLPQGSYLRLPDDVFEALFEEVPE